MKNKLQQKICAMFQRTIQFSLHIFSKLCVSLKRDTNTTEKDLCEKDKCGKFGKIKKWRNNISNEYKKIIMAKIEDFGKEYAEYIKTYYEIPTLITEVKTRIDKISYTENNKELTLIDKKKLVDEIEKNLIKESDDSRSYIEIVNKLRERLNG